MPTIFKYKRYRFFFFSNEGYEPVHIHVRKGTETAKFWLEPDIMLEYSYEMSPSELKEIEGIVREKKETFKEAWNAYFRSSSGG
ncbi:MAG: DUF4160 domain-containing protein [Thermodesulfovibrionales bacterium]|nr:DUF4160 domain-containing protein [Thermodesulfovibrionales bacterium]